MELLTRNNFDMYFLHDNFARTATARQHFVQRPL